VVDCTPENFYNLDKEDKFETIMKYKLVTLLWHLKHGVLRPREEERIVIFCNTIEIVRLVERTLKKLDPGDKKSGQVKRWKLYVLHGLRSQEEWYSFVDAHKSDN